MELAARLREVWPTTGSTRSKIEQVNALKTIGRPIDVPAAIIADYLKQRQLWPLLELYASAVQTASFRAALGMAPIGSGPIAANHLLMLLSEEGLLYTSRADVRALFEGLLDKLVAAEPVSIFTDKDKDNLIALTRPEVPLFASGVSALDVVRAGLS
jgi:hypothetical protein